MFSVLFSLGLACITSIQGSDTSGIEVAVTTTYNSGGFQLVGDQQYNKQMKYVYCCLHSTNIFIKDMHPFQTLQEFCHRLTKINIPSPALLTYLPKHQDLSHIQMLILEVLSVYQNKYYKEIKQKYMFALFAPIWTGKKKKKKIKIPPCITLQKQSGEDWETCSNMNQSRHHTFKNNVHCKLKSKESCMLFPYHPINILRDLQVFFKTRCSFSFFLIFFLYLRCLREINYVIHYQSLNQNLDF